MKQAERRKFYGDGRVFQRGKSGTWYARFCVNGTAFTERCVTEGGRPVETQKEAEIVLKRKLSEAGAGVFVPPQTRNLRVQALWDTLIEVYQQNGRQILDIEGRWRLHLAPYFGGRKIEQVTHDSIVAYRKKRLDEGAKPATVNREVILLHRMFVLGKSGEKVQEIPLFPQRLREDNVREGFVEEKQFRTILDGTRELWLRALLTTMYHTGNRRSELIPTRRHPERGLRVKQVELHNGLIRLNTKTKNGRARTLPITLDMKPLLTACVFGKQSNEHVFTLIDGENVRPVREDDLRTAWKQLSRILGLGRYIEQTTGDGDSKRMFRVWRPSLLIHDFRRSATRNLIQHGVSQAVAMQITGHVTDSVFRRYQIVSESEILDAGRRIAVKSIEEPDTQLRQDCYKFGTSTLLKPTAEA